jgi:ATP-binding cassette subfamily C (CFTR/MRP) protein 4
MKGSQTVLKNMNLNLCKGQITGVCGPVGCGKTSLIQAILGELSCISGSFVVRSQKIAYVSQIPWLISGSIKSNILFGHKFKAEWFAEVIKGCCLDVDFERLPDGYKTSIGPNGATLR